MSTVEKVQVEEAKAPTGAAPVTLGGCINIADIEVGALRREIAPEPDVRGPLRLLLKLY